MCSTLQWLRCIIVKHFLRYFFFQDLFFSSFNVLFFFLCSLFSLSFFFQSCSNIFYRDLIITFCACDKILFRIIQSLISKLFCSRDFDINRIFKNNFAKNNLDVCTQRSFFAKNFDYDDNINDFFSSSKIVESESKLSTERKSITRRNVILFFMLSFAFVFIFLNDFCWSLFNLKRFSSVISINRQAEWQR